MANEKRLIDANAIYDAVERRYKVSSGTEHRCERDLLDLICAADTVDAVEVVRCKDCIYNEVGSCTFSQYVSPADYSPDWFCADGERKDKDA